ncbi:MAG: hypothetical protein J5829_06520 [Lachnospiraceae bacterium]|nr:hypothetical protein [Lachnospiraceae bacterium]
MNENKLKKVVAIVVSILLMLGVAVIICNYLLNKYSVPDKEQRLRNLKATYGTEDIKGIDRSIIAGDIKAALSKYTNWDNLFLSEHFKEKYKNRKNIIDDVNNIRDIRSGLTLEYGDDVVIIFAEKKSGIFDTDESDDITTEYYFRYVLNEAGEIDDLILLKKQDVYTINGEPVDGNEWYGWQE